jgi:hypothetical protein
MRRIAASVSFVVLSILAPSALAADGSSGCGPGWYVLKDNSLVSSSLRAVTNGILWPSSTLGMTFGTSNCAKHKIVLREKESLHFATMAYHDLMVQMARGEGEHLAAFATTLRCGWRTQPLFNDTMRRSWRQLFPTDSTPPAELLGNVIEQIRAEPALAEACAAGLG